MNHAQEAKFAEEAQQTAPEQKPDGDNWHAGNAPSQVLRWGVEALAKAGTLAIIGVYPMNDDTFPIGMAMNKNLTIHMGNCNHRKYIPCLIELVCAHAFDPTAILTQQEPMTAALDAYAAFERRQPGWIKVELTSGSAS